MPDTMVNFLLGMVLLGAKINKITGKIVFKM